MTMGNDASAASGLALAINAAGNPAELARKLGISQQAVSQWKVIPYKRLMAVAAATRVPPHRLRPDLYSNYAKRKRRKN